MSRPNGVFKTENDYQKCISRELYEKTPKAVFAALVVSLMANHQGIEFADIDGQILYEWDTLLQNGIVPQKPPKLN